MSETIRVFIADDHTIVRSGIQALLETIDDLEVIGEAGDGRQAVAAVLALRPDVVLMDLEMPGLGGHATLRQQHRRRSPARLRDRRPARRRGLLGLRHLAGSPRPLTWAQAAGRSCTATRATKSH